MATERRLRLGLALGALAGASLAFAPLAARAGVTPPTAQRPGW
ncbi:MULTISPECIES: hypothetical protein [unclassified Synechococcus]|nr:MULTISPECIES: hypothetical protein [unclassified Synechococcus]